MKNDALSTKNNAENVTISRAEYDRLMQEVEHLTHINNWLREQLELLKKERFGSRHESASEEVIGQMMLFDEPEVYAYLEEITKRTTPVMAHERTLEKERVFLLDNLPDNAEVEVEVHELSAEERVCPECGAEMEAIGKEVVRTLEIIPAKFVVHEDQYITYACKQCAGEYSEETDDFQKTSIKKTPRVPAVFPYSSCSAAAAAYLMTQKYVMGTPLYRMELDFSRSGYSLSRQTMSNWMIYCANHWLAPLYERLHILLVTEDIIHADETELQVLHEPGRKATTKSFVWLYRTGKYTKHPIVLYEYQPGRGSCYPVKFLQGFTGYLQTDGYAGYEPLNGVTHVICMAHLRRKFHEAVTTLPNGKKSGASVEGEAYCERLFQLERAFAELSPEERYKKRQELAKPVLDEFLAWGSTRAAAKKSKLGEALTFLHNNGKGLSEYLSDGRLEISNNLAERSIKPFVIDRKNFLFANTPKGATASTVTFSIIQTAIENGLDPYRYLRHLFTEAPKLAAKDEDWVEAMLPWNVPHSCRART